MGGSTSAEAAPEAVEATAAAGQPPAEHSTAGSAAPGRAQPAPKVDSQAASATASKPNPGKPEKGKGGGAKAKEEDAETSKVVVKNLSEDSTEATVLALFAKHGNVKAVEVKTRQDGKCRGFGFVTFSCEAEAKASIAALHDTDCGDKKLVVLLADRLDAKGKGKGKEGKGQDGKGQDGKGKGQGKGKTPSSWSAPPLQGKGKGKGKDAAQVQAYNEAYMRQMQAMYAGWQQYAAAYQYAAMAAASPAAQLSSQGAAGQAQMGFGTLSAPPAKEFEGSLRSISDKNGYGFVACTETFSLYGRDVYVGKDVMPSGAKPLDRLRFKVQVNEKNHPKAVNARIVSIGS